MKSRILWIVGGILAFLLFVIAYMPAAQVLGRVSLPNNVQVSGVSGTIWNGNAQQVVVNNLPVSLVEWDIHPFSLLLGKISADIKGGNLRQSDAVAFEGEVMLNVFNMGHVRSDDFLLFLPTDRVLAEVSLPLPVNAGGRFRVRMEQFAFGPKCEAMRGFGDWLNATVQGTQGPIDFGNYTATLRCEGDDIGVKVAEPNLLGLSFDAVINPETSDLTTEGQFKIDDSLPNEVHQAAQLFGQPDADGYTRFRIPN